MPIPRETELIDGLLKAMRLMARPASIEEQEAEIIRLLNISEADASEIHEGNRTKLSYRLAWARTYLKSIGLLRQTERGIWELTDQGNLYESISDLPDIGAAVFDELSEGSGGLEGIDRSAPEKFGEYPIDSVLIRQETRTVFEIVRRIRDERFIMDPDFQRDFIWKLEKQSKLIESMVMRIPLPVFYLAEREDGKTVVVDGLQRLTTFLRFLDNDFSLRDLQLATELNGMRYSDLPMKLQNRLEDTQLILYLIDSKVPEQARLDIFDRVNGGVPLTRQQMRNSIYCGEATRWLKREVESEEFAVATGRSLDWRSMRDRECVNRFCAFSLLGVSAYSKGDMDAFLAQVLKKMNVSPAHALESLSLSFRTSMKNNYQVFGSHSFRKHRSIDDRRSVINVALFDVFSVLLSRVSEEAVLHTADQIHQAFFELMDDAEFMDAITISTNATSKVQTRFEVAEAKLGSILNVYGH
jgi:hypothetical protein